MDYADYIDKQRKRWTGKKVEYEGTEYTVIDVDYNGMLLIDKPTRFTETTAIAPETVHSLGIAV